MTDPTRGRGSNNPNVLDLILSHDDEIIYIYIYIWSEPSVRRISTSVSIVCTVVDEIIGDVEYINPLGRSDHCILIMLCTIKLNNYTKRRK